MQSDLNNVIISSKRGAGPDGNNKKKVPELSYRIQLNINPELDKGPEFSYIELTKQAKKTKKEFLCNRDEIEDEEENQKIAQYYESKYSSNGKRMKKNRIRDLSDAGYGYDESDPFVDNSECYDEVVPHSLTTKHGGFYINTGVLEFRQVVSDSSTNQETIPDDESDDSEIGLKKTSNKNKMLADESDGENFKKSEKATTKKRLKSRSSEASEGKRRKMGGVNILVKNSAKKQNKVRQLVKKAREQQASYSSSVKSNSKKSLKLDSLENGSNLDQRLNMNSTASHNEDGYLHNNHENNPSLNVDLLMGTTEAVDPLNLEPKKDVDMKTFFEALPIKFQEKIMNLKKVAKTNEKEGKVKFFSPECNKCLLDIELDLKHVSGRSRSHLIQLITPLVPCSRETLVKRMKRLVTSQQPLLKKQKKSHRIGKSSRLIQCRSNKGKRKKMSGETTKPLLNKTKSEQNEKKVGKSSKINHQAKDCITNKSRNRNGETNNKPSSKKEENEKTEKKVEKNDSKVILPAVCFSSEENKSASNETTNEDEILKPAINELRTAVKKDMVAQEKKYVELCQAQQMAKCDEQKNNISLPGNHQGGASVISDEDGDMMNGIGTNGVSTTTTTNSNGEERTKRTYAPRRKFAWSDTTRTLFFRVVRIKLDMYDQSKIRGNTTVSDYLKNFFELELKMLWPKQWMQSRTLYKESRKIHQSFTNDKQPKQKLAAPSVTNATTGSTPSQKKLSSNHSASESNGSIKAATNGGTHQHGNKHTMMKTPQQHATITPINDIMAQAELLSLLPGVAPQPKNLVQNSDNSWLFQKTIATAKKQLDTSRLNDHMITSPVVLSMNNSKSPASSSVASTNSAVNSAAPTKPPAKLLPSYTIDLTSPPKPNTLASPVGESDKTSSNTNELSLSTFPMLLQASTEAALNSNKVTKVSAKDNTDSSTAGQHRATSTLAKVQQLSGNKGILSAPIAKAPSVKSHHHQQPLNCSKSASLQTAQKKVVHHLPVGQAKVQQQTSNISKASSQSGSASGGVKKTKQPPKITTPMNSGSSNSKKNTPQQQQQQPIMDGVPLDLLNLDLLKMFSNPATYLGPPGANDLSLQAYASQYLADPLNPLSYLMMQGAQNLQNSRTPPLPTHQTTPKQSTSSASHRRSKESASNSSATSSHPSKYKLKIQQQQNATKQATARHHQTMNWSPQHHKSPSPGSANNNNMRGVGGSIHKSAASPTQQQQSAASNNKQISYQKSSPTVSSSSFKLPHQTPPKVNTFKDPTARSVISTPQIVSQRSSSGSGGRKSTGDASMLTSQSPRTSISKRTLSTGAQQQTPQPHLSPFPSYFTPMSAYNPTSQQQQQYINNSPTSSALMQGVGNYHLPIQLSPKRNPTSQHHKTSTEAFVNYTMASLSDGQGFGIENFLNMNNSKHKSENAPK